MSIEKLTDDTRFTHELIPYTQINTQVIQHITDMEAGFVWVYLLTKPRNWKVVKEHLKNHFNIGDGKIKKIFSYLNKHKLIEYIQPRSKDGTVGKIEIKILNGSRYIKENAQITGGSEIRPAVDRSNGFGALQIKENTNERKKQKLKSYSASSEQISPNYPPPTQNLFNKINNLQNSGPDLREKTLNASSDARSLFEEFWSTYPRKKDRERARKIWLRKNLDDKADEIIADVKNRTLNEASWQEKQFIPHPSTYLNNERWHDEVTPPPKSKKSNNAFSNFISNQQQGVTYDEHGHAINPLD